MVAYEEVLYLRKRRYRRNELSLAWGIASFVVSIVAAEVRDVCTQYRVSQNERDWSSVVVGVVLI